MWKKTWPPNNTPWYRNAHFRKAKRETFFFLQLIKLKRGAKKGDDWNRRSRTRRKIARYAPTYFDSSHTGEIDFETARGKHKKTAKKWWHSINTSTLLTCDVLALLHDLHPADGLVLFHLVGLVPGLAVGLVVGRADVGAERLVATLANHGRVTDVDRLVERLRFLTRKKRVTKAVTFCMCEWENNRRGDRYYCEK